MIHTHSQKGKKHTRLYNNKKIKTQALLVLETTNIDVSHLILEQPKHILLHLVNVMIMIRGIRFTNQSHTHTKS
jgi:hypothetical protein